VELRSNSRGDALNRSQLTLQLQDLDFMLETLERMNLEQETALSAGLTRLLHELGLLDGAELGPADLMFRVLDKQQQVRRRLSTLRRLGTT
jgi:hypothetical protein